MITNSLFRECLSQIPQQKRREFDFLFSIAERIVTAMKDKGLTNADLAKRLHKPEAEISKWLTGRYDFSLTELMRVSETLGVSLLGEEEVKKICI